MKKFIFIFFFILFLVLIINNSCEDKKEELIIYIQPFDDFPNNYLSHVKKELKKYYNKIEVKKSIPIPKNAFSKFSLRYRADTLIQFLSNETKNGHKTIGLTNKDICTKKGQYTDWGIFGLGYCPGKSCVVSSFRLTQINIKEQLFKVVIHELGHTFSLPHCPNKSCFMRDAEGGNPLNEETSFCTKCTKVLKENDWKL